MPSLWIASAAVLALGEAVAALCGLSIHVSAPAAKLLGVAACCAMLTALQGRIDAKVVRMVADILIVSSLFAVVSMSGGLWSYIVASVSHGYCDDWFMALDRSIGFDWIGWYRLEQLSATTLALSRSLYTMFWVVPFVVIVSLVVSDRQRRLATFLKAHMIGLALTVSIFALLPLRSPAVELLGMNPNYMPFAGTTHVIIIDSLRDGSMTLIDLGKLSGIIGFPSYHAAGSILFVWACWPVRLVRWPMLAINLGVIAVTPVEGAHYLVDVIGGVIVAAVAIMVAGRWRLPAFASRRPTYAMALET